MSLVPAGEITTRQATDADRAAVLELCRRSLGWRPGDPDEAFFTWKHDDNPFGVSPSWVAVAEDGRIVGLRMFLRWSFVDPSGASFSAVRAVDTATDPDWQGRGIFTKLTTGALPDLIEAGTGAVFNTPNDKSRPGYLKMGWSVVGQVPVTMRLRSPMSLRRLATARTAAELWSEPISCGLDAAAAFADGDTTARLLERSAPFPGISTNRSVDYLRWRYRFEPLRYRVAPIGDDLADGVIVFRVRRRGTALEATVCDVIAPPRTRLAGAFRSILKESGADYLLAASGAGLSSGFVPVPRLGPILTWRPLARAGVPAMADLSLAMGDVELF